MQGGQRAPNSQSGFNGRLADANHYSDVGEDSDLAVSPSDGSAEPLGAAAPFFLSQFCVDQEMGNTVVIGADEALGGLAGVFEESEKRSGSVFWPDL